MKISLAIVLAVWFAPVAGAQSVTEPAKPAQPAVAAPAQPGQPGTPAKTVPPATPAEPAKPAIPAEPAQPAVPAGPERKIVITDPKGKPVDEAAELRKKHAGEIKTLRESLKDKSNKEISSAVKAREAEQQAELKALRGNKSHGDRRVDKNYPKPGKNRMKEKNID